jgi:hypothetical protein
VRRYGVTPCAPVYGAVKIISVSFSAAISGNSICGHGPEPRLGRVGTAFGLPVESFVKVGSLVLGLIRTIGHKLPVIDQNRNTIERPLADFLREQKLEISDCCSYCTSPPVFSALNSAEMTTVQIRMNIRQ